MLLLSFASVLACEESDLLSRVCVDLLSKKESSNHLSVVLSDLLSKTSSLRSVVFPCLLAGVFSDLLPRKMACQFSCCQLDSWHDPATLVFLKHPVSYELLTRVFDTFEVPLDDKEGNEPVKTDFLEETFLTMCQLKRIDGMWRLGTGKGRRRDVDEAPAENVENVEENEGEEVHQDFDWEQVEEDAEIQGEEQIEEEAEV
ncbi:hypothetical protein Dimus_000557 [Dionaea muscipula]